MLIARRKCPVRAGPAHCQNGGSCVYYGPRPRRKSSEKSSPNFAGCKRNQAAQQDHLQGDRLVCENVEREHQAPESEPARQREQTSIRCVVVVILFSVPSLEIQWRSQSSVMFWSHGHACDPDEHGTG